jgi:hypothetical protein
MIVVYERKARGSSPSYSLVFFAGLKPCAPSEKAKHWLFTQPVQAHDWEFCGAAEAAPLQNLAT